MKKTVKMILALTLVLVLTLGLGVTSYADAEIGSGGTVGTNAGTALDKTVVIQKELVVYSNGVGGERIVAPSICFKYTLSAGTANKTITDADGITVKTKAGILPSRTTAYLQYDADLGDPAPISYDPRFSTSNEGNFYTTINFLRSSTSGTSNLAPIIFDFSDVTFTAAGVYRYVIMEEVARDQTKEANAIKDGTISDTRYLDVYVRDPVDTETERQIYGYALFTNDNDINAGAASGASDTVAAAVKTTGFVADGSLTADQYYTFGLVIKKNLLNDAANLSHEFPFDIRFSNPNPLEVTASFKTTGTTFPFVANDTEATSTYAGLGTADERYCFDVINIPSHAFSTATNHSNKIALGDFTETGDSITVWGIPAGTTVYVYENNDIEGNTYNSSYTVGSGSASTAKAISWITTDDANKSDVAEVETTAYTTPGNVDVTFTNTLALISPTGVVVRYAPYALILGAALVLLFLARRRDRDAA